MSYSQKKSKTTFVSIAVLTSIASLACWQFYKYATFKHDNGLLNIEGGVSHMVWALLLAFIACGLGFVIASRLLRYDVNDQLHITSRPGGRNSPSE
jgi:hypothetical protein